MYFVLIAKGVQYIIEMQVASRAGFEQCCAARVFISQMNEGEMYAQLERG